MTLNKSTRSYYFRQLVFNHARESGNPPLTWRQSRLLFKGATNAAMRGGAALKGRPHHARHGARMIGKPPSTKGNMP